MIMGAFRFTTILFVLGVPMIASAFGSMDPTLTDCQSAYLKIKNCKSGECGSDASDCVNKCSKRGSGWGRPNGGGGTFSSNENCTQQLMLTACLAISPTEAGNFARQSSARAKDKLQEAIYDCTTACSNQPNPVARFKLSCPASIDTSDLSAASAGNPNDNADQEGDATPVAPGTGTPSDGGNDPGGNSAASNDTPPDTGSGDDPLTTASADVQQQQAMARGLADIPIPNINIGGSGAGSLDFTGGPTAQDNWNSVSSDVTSATIGNGFSASPTFQNKPFEVAGPGLGDPAKPGPGGPGNSGGMQGSGGSSSGGPGIRGGGSPPPSARRYSGGGGGSVPSSNSGFYPPGGKSPGGGASKVANRTTASKSKIGSSVYKPKVGGEGLALSRLFGGGSRPDESIHSYGSGDVQGRSCLDTVFCNMESYFQQVDRYPNSDLKSGQ